MLLSFWQWGFGTHLDAGARPSFCLNEDTGAHVAQILNVYPLDPTAQQCRRNVQEALLTHAAEQAVPVVELGWGQHVCNQCPSGGTYHCDHELSIEHCQQPGNGYILQHKGLGLAPCSHRDKRCCLRQLGVHTACCISSLHNKAYSKKLTSSAALIHPSLLRPCFQNT